MVGVVVLEGEVVISPHLPRSPLDLPYISPISLAVVGVVILEGEVAQQEQAREDGPHLVLGRLGHVERSERLARALEGKVLPRVRVGLG